MSSQLSVFLWVGRRSGQTCKLRRGDIETGVTHLRLTRHITCDTKRKRTTRYRLQGNGKEPLEKIYTIYGDRSRVRAQAASRSLPGRSCRQRGGAGEGDQRPRSLAPSRPRAICMVGGHVTAGEPPATSCRVGADALQWRQDVRLCTAAARGACESIEPLAGRRSLGTSEPEPQEALQVERLLLQLQVRVRGLRWRR